MIIPIIVITRIITMVAKDQNKNSLIYIYKHINEQDN